MRIGFGDTAELVTSGLDDGQAAGLLSAVSGYGLPVVEPGPTPDPVAAGLNTAITRAYHAWIATQPQLILELWPRDDGLDEAGAGAAGFVEPARTPLATEGGLASQAYDGRGANPRQDARRGQKGA